ncbi:hypothetical protein ABIB45_004425 [Arthrobacter sp. UYCo732]
MTKLTNWYEPVVWVRFRDLVVIGSRESSLRIRDLNSLLGGPNLAVLERITKAYPGLPLLKKSRKRGDMQ